MGDDDMNWQYVLKKPSDDHVETHKKPVDDVIHELEEIAEENDLDEKEWDSVDDASDYLFENKVKKADAMMELKKMVGKEGDLDDIMKMIDNEFGVKTTIIYDSSSQPVLGFELPIYVQCYMGTKERPMTTSEFTIKDVGINQSQIK